jgi:hypothetical protein
MRSAPALFVGIAIAFLDVATGLQQPAHARASATGATMHGAGSDGPCTAIETLALAGTVSDELVASNVNDEQLVMLHKLKGALALLASQLAAIPELKECYDEPPSNAASARTRIEAGFALMAAVSRPRCRLRTRSVWLDGWMVRQAELCCKTIRPETCSKLWTPTRGVHREPTTAPRSTFGS